MIKLQEIRDEERARKSQGWCEEGRREKRGGDVITGDKGWGKRERERERVRPEVGVRKGGGRKGGVI